MGMEHVLGIGGYFLRAADPAALSAWYRDCLGLDADENGLWQQGAGPTVFAAFESDTGYFGSRAQQTMLNFRVRDLDAMLAQLRAKGADATGKPRKWRASAGSPGSPTPRATASNSGSPPDPAVENPGQDRQPLPRPPSPRPAKLRPHPLLADQPGGLLPTATALAGRHSNSPDNQLCHRRARTVRVTIQMGGWRI